MTQIEQMIKDMCPYGVEWKTLGEVCNTFMGEFVHKNKQNPNGPYPVYNGGTTPTGFYDEYNATANKVIISARGAGAGYVNRVETNFWAGNSCHVLEITNPNLEWRFLYYLLKNQESEMMNHQQKGGGVPAISKKQINDIEIPLPPLEIQKKIVEFLDKFSALAAELQAELQMRRKQYEYYRTHLLTPHSDCNSAGDSTDDCNWEWKTLGEICEVQDYVANGSFGDIKKNVKYYNEPNYALLVRITDLTNKFQNSQKVYIDEHAYNYMTKSRLDGDEIIISNVGSCGATFLCPKLDVPMSLAPNAILVRTPNNHFYYHWFCSKFGQDAINKIVAKSAMPKFNKTEFRKILLPVPSAKEQARIADILDKFAVLTTDFSDGIPAEQAAQQKRYEYYRDLLLTFPRKAV